MPVRLDATSRSWPCRRWLVEDGPITFLSPWRDCRGPAYPCRVCLNGRRQLPYRLSFLWRRLCSHFSSRRVPVRWQCTLPCTKSARHLRQNPCLLLAMRPALQNSLRSIQKARCPHFLSTAARSPRLPPSSSTLPNAFPLPACYLP